ncbi:hypothetical protein E2C01_059286 [Portunus trituberculatus]|uniref:Uncharacterized protein n=1 Tax=Portunus trituberculatus TaxID=210409 RepID=A0A5B7H759_PORTR|nr:hypothetical protein [Portunus trituberculatus]
MGKMCHNTEGVEIVKALVINLLTSIEPSYCQ